MFARMTTTTYVADSGIALSSTYNVIREENLHDRGKSPYDVILTEDLSDIGSGVYDVARKENMNDSADATRSPYVVVSSEYLYRHLATNQSRLKRHPFHYYPLL